MSVFAFLLAAQLLAPTTDVVLKQPQVASTGDMIGVVAGGGNDIYYFSSTNDGQTFSRPSKIQTKGKLSLGRHRGPRLVYQTGNVVVTAIVGKQGGGADGDLWAWRSNDNGKTWLDPVRVNDVPGAAREGLHAMTSGNGWVLAVWLDLRSKGTRLYGSKSENGGATWSKNFLVYESPEGTICQCCHPSMLLGPGNGIFVMWRNVIAGNRDMYLTVSHDGALTWEMPVKFGRESWKLEACPMDGGGLTSTGTDKVFSVWRRDKAIYVATTLGKESKLGEGKDPTIAAGLNEDLVAAWTGVDGSIQVRSAKKDEVRTLSPKGGYPQLIFTSRSMLAFWEEGEGISMATVD